MIPFNVPPCVGDELDYVKQAIDSHIICGDGAFTKPVSYTHLTLPTKLEV